jgi:hypothetical protein
MDAFAGLTAATAHRRPIRIGVEAYHGSARAHLKVHYMKSLPEREQHFTI